MKVGYIGLGLMGNPMSKNLVKNGHEVTVWNRTASRMQELVEAGAKASRSAAEVACNSEFIFTNVSDSADVEEVVLGEGGIIEGASAGSVVIDNSTISPDVTKRIASKLSEKSVDMLDAPVSGGDIGAAAGTLSVMVGGEREIFDRCLPVLKAIGTSITYCGEIGLGQATKLSNQILGLGNMAAACEAIVFATKAGVDPEALINAWAGGAANSWMMANLGPKIFKRDFAPGFMVDLAQKDLRLVLESASEMNVPLLTTPIVNQMYRSVQQDGDGTDGIQAYVKALEKLAGMEIGS
ncbi:MAG: NAD(P)-binding domain-containing protein [SAR202 cluster bacterium]|jgi:3-hydroxyisobutyrate dehydrogenase|nr:NAD(P)-binding domain-containing protein [SAR202 cluster bacterium]